MSPTRFLPLAATLLWLCAALLPSFAHEAPAVATFPKRPFVLLNEDELAALRTDLAKPGWKADLYHADRGFAVMSSGRGVRANADLWLKRSIEIPARGGHFHLFFCVDGDRLEFPKDQRFVPGPYRCPKCGRLYSGEKYEAALRRIVHGWLSQAARDLALVAAIEHKPQYAAKAAEILLKYAAAYPGPHTTTVKGGMIYQSLDEAMWVIPLAQAYDLICDDLSPDQRTRIETFLRTVAQGLQRCGTRGNWGSWHLSAVGVVGYAIEDRELIGWATEHFKLQIRDQLGDDGLWPESVHTYHFFPLLAFADFAEAAWHDGTDLYHWEAKPGKSLLLMFSAPLQYAYPDLRLPAINDGWFQSFLPADLYELAYHRTHDPRFAWVLANGYRPGAAPAGRVNTDPRDSLRSGLYAFLFGGPILTNGTPPPGTSVNFPVLGICMLRSTNGATLSFDYGPFLGHGQLDKMGITLFAHRKLWLADYGTPGYGASILPWYESTFAHNTVVVDGKSQARTGENNVKLWLGGPDIEAAQSETAEAYPGVTQTRTVVRIGDYFVVADRLKSESEHTYDLYLHSEGALSLDSGLPNAQPVKPPVRWIEQLRVGPPTPAVSGRWAEDGNGVGFWVGGNGPITPISGQCPAESGSRKVHLLLARQHARAAEFVTVLYPYAGKLALAVESRGEELTIRHGSSSDVLRLRLGQVAPRARAAAVGDTTPRALLRQLAYLHVLEPHVAIVVLEEDMAFDLVSEPGDVLELALRHRRLDDLAAAFVFEHFHAVEPVLDVVALDQNPRVVDLAGRLERSGALWREHVIEGGREMLAAGPDGVRGLLVVNHLVFVAKRLLARLDDEVLHAAIASPRQLPIPFQVKVVELGIADDFSPAPFAPALAETMQPAVLDDPARRRKRLLLEEAPAIRGLAIKEQLPAIRLLLFGELVGRGRGERRDRAGQGYRQSPTGSRHTKHLHAAMELTPRALGN